MDFTPYLQTTQWVIFGLTFLSSSILMISFSRLPKKAFGLYMIIVLNICALLFSLIGMMSMLFLTSDITAIIFGELEMATYNFALYWSTSIAILVYVIIKTRKSYDPTKLILYTVLSCLAFVGLFVIL